MTLSHCGFKHLTVNYSMHFVDPDTKMRTNNIERLWRDVKTKVPRYCGRKKHFVEYLVRSMFLMAHMDGNVLC